MNVYEMSQWIMHNDPTAIGKYKFLATFLASQYLSRVFNTRAYFIMLRDLMVQLLLEVPYPEPEED